MKKVVLTKEQAEAVKLAVADYGSDIVMDDHHRTIWGGTLKALNELPTHQLARALYVGYEIEPEYVPFEKAMEELKNGRPIICHVESSLSGEVVKERHQITSHTSSVELTGRQIIDGKWSVE